MNIILMSMITAGALLAQPAMAQTPPETKPAHKAPVKQKTAPVVKKEVAKAPAIDDEDDDGRAPSVEGSVVTEYHCDHGQGITFYQNAGDEAHVAIRWNKEILRMRRVTTSTGADRFESKRHGLVWIGIPAKSMLLDSKKGQQLANECKNAQQIHDLKNPPQG